MEASETRERLSRASSAYEMGDFAAVRGLCASLRRADDPQAGAEAAALARRVAVDPAAALALGAALALLLAILVMYVG